MNEVKIKDVESESIWMEELLIGRLSIKKLVGFPVIFFIFFFVVGYLINPVILIGICFALLGTAFIGFVFWITRFFDDEFPGYKIFIWRKSNIDVQFIKTTPEEDQIAICCAVRELEPKAREMSEKKREMEDIASKCR